jgi:5'-methylthioadenosine phosphorylase
MPTKPVLAVIGGSGLYEMPGLKYATQHHIDTPFGKPSAPIVVGYLGGKTVAFLARHGIGHTISPTEVNSRANIYALRTLGVNHVVSISACGSLREDYAPGQIVIPDQLFDFTRDRKRSFFEEGHVAHVSVAEPFCQELGNLVYESVKQTGATVHNGGTYITIEGPRFSTRAESNVYRSWGMSIIGMTTSPEAFLAREAEMCYAVMAHVTDYDVWHVTEESVTAEMVIRVLNKNTTTAQQSIANLVQILDPERDCVHHHALINAFLTQPGAISAEARDRLKLLTDKYQS